MECLDIDKVEKLKESMFEYACKVHGLDTAGVSNQKIFDIIAFSIVQYVKKELHNDINKECYD